MCDEAGRFHTGDSDLDTLLGLAFDMGAGKANMDSGIFFMEVLERFRARITETCCEHSRAEHLADNSPASAGSIHWCPDCGAIAINGKWRTETKVTRDPMLCDVREKAIGADPEWRYEHIWEYERDKQRYRCKFCQRWREPQPDAIREA